MSTPTSSTPPPQPASKAVSCICAWESCRALQEVFIKHSDIRAGHVTIRPGPKKTGPNFLGMMARHLEDGKEGLSSTSLLVDRMSNVKSTFNVAYLHYTPAQIQLLFLPKTMGGKNMRASTTIDLDLAERTCYNNVPDPRDKTADGTFFISPSVPETVVKAEARHLESSRTSGRTTTASSRVQHRDATVDEAKTSETIRLEQDNARLTIMANDEKIKSLEKKLQKKEEELAKKQAELTALRVKYRQEQRSNKRKVDSMESSQSKKIRPNSITALENNANLKMEDLSSWVIELGGLSRITLTSDEWHTKQNATVNVFGFSSLAETKTVIKERFPSVDVEHVGVAKVAQRGKQKGKFVMVPVGLTQFEQCLAAKMYIQSIPQRQRLAVIWGTSPSAMGRYLKEWVPLWRKT